jgi:hypothetical protein
LVLPGRGRLELGGPGVPGDGCGSARPDLPWAGALRLAGKRRGGGCPRAGTEALGQWLDTARAGITRLRPESFRNQFARTLGLQRRTTAKRAPPGLDDIDNDLSHGCGGDMSMPQKYPPTRHYLQTTSDNCRYGSDPAPSAK